MAVNGSPRQPRFSKALKAQQQCLGSAAGWHMLQPNPSL